MHRFLAALLSLLLVLAPMMAHADSLSISAWQTGDSLNATNLNSRTNSISTWANGNIANDNLKSTAALAGSKLNLTSGTGRLSNSTSVTDSAPIITSEQTWNDAAEVFTGWRLNIINTNSASTSRLLDLQVDSTVIASISRTGQLVLNSQAYASGPRTLMDGAWFNIASATYTDNITAASGTAPRFIAYSFQRPAIAAANSSVTTTNAATVFIASAPVAGDNMTLTNRYALWVDQGDVRIGGNLFASGTTTITGDLAIPGGITGSFVVDGAGPHAIGGATASAFPLIVYAVAGTGLKNSAFFKNSQAAAADVGAAIGFLGVSDLTIGQIAGAWNGAATTDGYLSFYTQRSSSQVEGMRLTSGGILALGTTNVTGAVAGNIVMTSGTAATSPVAGNVVIYVDTSGGKVRLRAIFPSGVSQAIATEP